jgi:hypothetical protein
VAGESGPLVFEEKHAAAFEGRWLVLEGSTAGLRDGDHGPRLEWSGVSLGLFREGELVFPVFADARGMWLALGEGVPFVEGAAPLSWRVRLSSESRLSLRVADEWVLWEEPVARLMVPGLTLHPPESGSFQVGSFRALPADDTARPPVPATVAAAGRPSASGPRTSRAASSGSPAPRLAPVSRERATAGSDAPSLTAARSPAADDPEVDLERRRPPAPLNGLHAGGALIQSGRPFVPPPVRTRSVPAPRE